MLSQWVYHAFEQLSQGEKLRMPDVLKLCLSGHTQQKQKT
jgi:hypothetical protein